MYSQHAFSVHYLYGVLCDRSLRSVIHIFFYYDANESEHWRKLKCVRVENKFAAGADTHARLRYHRLALLEVMCNNSLISSTKYLAVSNIHVGTLTRVFLLVLLLLLTKLSPGSHRHSAGAVDEP